MAVESVFKDVERIRKGYLKKNRRDWENNVPTFPNEWMCNCLVWSL